MMVVERVQTKCVIQPERAGIRFAPIFVILECIPCPDTHCPGPTERLRRSAQLEERV